jgi:hypothetical protein
VPSPPRCGAAKLVNIKSDRLCAQAAEDRHGLCGGPQPEHRDIPPGERKACCGVRRARRGRNIEKSLHNGLCKSGSGGKVFGMGAAAFCSPHAKKPRPIMDPLSVVP